MLKILLILLISNSYCYLSINGKLVTKKGIDHGFIIETETHFLKEFQGKKPIQIRTKSGIRLELEASFYQIANFYGPSDLVVLNGELYDKSGNIIELFGKKPFLLRLNQERTFKSKEWKGELFEFTLKPEVN